MGPSKLSTILRDIHSWKYLLTSLTVLCIVVRSEDGGEDEDAVSYLYHYPHRRGRYIGPMNTPITITIT